MKSHYLFRAMLLAGVFSCCSVGGVMAGSEEIDIHNKNQSSVSCESEENCAIMNPKGAYLTESFVETYEVSPDEIRTVQSDALAQNEAKPGIESDRVLATSRPAGIKAISVKDKKKQQPQMQVFSDGVALDGPTIIQVNEKTIVQKKAPKEVVQELPASKEEIGQVVPAVEVSDLQKDVAEAKTVEKPAPVKTEVVKKEAVEPGVHKTIRTTITEKTTRMKKPDVKKVDKKDGPMSLVDKITFGEKVQNWEAPAGETLRSLLMKWGEESGWTVVWKLDRDYHLEAGVVFRGNFIDASGAIVRSFARATPAPIGTFYQGNRVLVISTQEDENER